MIANKGAANTVRHTLAAAGVSPAGITSGNIYAQNLFASGWLSSPWEHFAFADIGEDSTRIEIFSGTNIALSRTIKTGLRSLVTALQESYGGRRKKTPPPPVVPPMPRHLPMERWAGSLPGLTPNGSSRFIVHVALGPVPVDPAAGIPAAGAVSSTAVPNGYGMASAPVAPSVPQRPYPPSPKKFRTMKFPMKKPAPALRKQAPHAEEEESLLLRLSSLSEVGQAAGTHRRPLPQRYGDAEHSGRHCVRPGGCMALALKKFETSLGLPAARCALTADHAARLRIWKRRWPDPPTKACCKPSA